MLGAPRWTGRVRIEGWRWGEPVERLMLTHPHLQAAALGLLNSVTGEVHLFPVSPDVGLAVHTEWFFSHRGFMREHKGQ
jgi:hypothetical protein